MDTLIGVRIELTLLFAKWVVDGSGSRYQQLRLCKTLLDNIQNVFKAEWCLLNLHWICIFVHLRSMPSLHLKT